ncbi:MAG: lmo0937 family membrane protein [Acidaminococcaceae bacterium]|nr:lmo0937 family membrane protein [Acidaminococcaceae bacterium]
MGLLRIMVLVILVLWLLGFAFNIGGSLVHTLLVVAGIVFIVDIISGRRSI